MLRDTFEHLALEQKHCRIALIELVPQPSVVPTFQPKNKTLLQDHTTQL